MADLHGRTAMIIGASSGIGRRTAERFLAAGANLGVVARREALLGELTGSGEALALIHPGDASVESDVDRAFTALEKRFGPCEILVCCAGLAEPRPLVDTSFVDWRRAMAANLDSVFLPVRRALPAMIAAGRGSIVLLASISGVHGSSKFPGMVPYCTAKSGVIAFAEALAAEVGPSGVRVNALSPGSVDTEMLRAANPDAIPAMSPDEVADAILFLISAQSRPINGQNLHVYSS
ncbi:MAG TPA: SDR family NAD(P)-dependent oxidoreductase [Thermoanaerobaculia bacterium]|nr:SDR family NAD(P)-dependent oxidoreductase [Thermoanaerobaculia bacterium]